jgi:hypothetical protein
MGSPKVLSVTVVASVGTPKTLTALASPDGVVYQELAVGGLHPGGARLHQTRFPFAHRDLLCYSYLTNQIPERIIFD